MSALSSVLVKFTADMSEFSQKMKQGLSEIEQAGKQAESTGSKMGGVFEKLKGIAVPAIGAISTALGGLSAFKGIDFNANMESALMSFEVLLKDAQKAKDMVEELKTFAAKTPFEFPGLQNSAKLMLAMGMNAKDVMPNLRSIGDAVAAIGGNEETLNGVTMALGQMYAKGKVSAEEMNQLAERGIPAWDIMAEKMGMSKQELMKLSEQGKLMADVALPALIDGMGTRFAGAMDKLSKSFTGQMSTLKDNVNMLLGAAMEPLFNSLRDKILPAVNELTIKLKEGFQSGGLKGAIEAAFPPALATTINTILTALKGVYDFIKNNWSAIGPILAGVLAGFMAYQALTGIVSAFNAVKLAISGASTVLALIASPIGIAAVAIGVLVAAGVLLYKNWDTIKDTASKAWDAVKNAVKSAIDFIANLFLNFTPLGIIIKNWDAIREATSKAWEAIKDVISNALKPITEAVKNAWEGIKSTTQSAGDAVKNTVQNGWNAVKSVTETVWNGIKNFLQNTWNSIKTNTVTTLNAVKSTTETVYNSIKTFLQNTWNSIKTQIDQSLNAIKTSVQNGWNQTKSITEQVYSSIKSFLQTTWNAIKSQIDQSLNAIKSAIQTGWNQVKSTTEQVYNAIKSFLQNTWNQIKSQIDQSLNAIKSAIQNAWNQIKSNLESTLNGIKSSVQSGWNNIKSTTDSVWNNIKSSISNAINQAKQAVDSAVGSIKSALNGVRDTISSVVESAKNAYNQARDMAGRAADAARAAASNAAEAARSAVGAGGAGTSPPKMAKGGFFNRATNIIIGEAGPEAALPLQGHRMRPFAVEVARQMASAGGGTGGGGGVTINVDQLAVREEADINRIATELYRLQKRGQRAKGVI